MSLNRNEPSLKHVMEYKRNGYEFVTIDEAIKEFPFQEVKACSRKFMCGLCLDYVLLTGPGEKTRHFRHEHDMRRNCPDEANYNSQHIKEGCNNIRKQIKSLPLYLKVENGYVTLEIGFPPLSNEALSEAQGEAVCITAGDRKVIKRYNINYDNFSNRKLERREIGTECYKEYKLVYIKDGIEIKNSAAMEIWGNKISGIDTNGALFELSGKKLLEYSCAKTQKYYYLITREKDLRTNDIIHIELKYTINHSTWYVYLIIADKLTRDAANFFIKYHIFLTDKVSEFIPMWPPCSIKEGHIIIHRGKNLSLFYNNDVSEKTEIYLDSTKLQENKDSSFIYIDESKLKIQTLFAINKFKILQYAYLWQDSSGEHTKKPKIKITDCKNKILKNDCYDNLPEEHKIYIESSYSGFAEILEDDFIVKKIEIKAKQKMPSIKIKYGQTIQIYQGLDIVRSIKFSRDQNKTTNCDIMQSKNDERIYSYLVSCSGKMVFAPHYLGALASKLRNMPRTRKWLYTSIRKQSIAENALKILKNCKL